MGLDEPTSGGGAEESDTALLARARAFLKAKRLGLDPESADRAAWDEFYIRFSPIVRDVVRRRLPAVARDDGFQEAWRTLIGLLPDFLPDPSRGRVRDWVAGVAWRAAANLARALAIRAAVSLQELQVDSRIDSRDHPATNPSVSLLRRELVEQVRAALAITRRRTAEVTFEVFRRHSVDGEPLRVIADALNLTLGQAQHMDRMARAEFRRAASHLAPHGDMLGWKGGGGGRGVSSIESHEILSKIPRTSVSNRDNSRVAWRDDRVGRANRASRPAISVPPSPIHPPLRGPETREQPKEGAFRSRGLSTIRIITMKYIIYLFVSLLFGQVLGCGGGREVPEVPADAPAPKVELSMEAPTPIKPRMDVRYTGSVKVAKGQWEPGAVNIKVSEDLGGKIEQGSVGIPLETKGGGVYTFEATLRSPPRPGTYHVRALVMRRPGPGETDAEKQPGYTDRVYSDWIHFEVPP